VRLRGCESVSRQGFVYEPLCPSLVLARFPIRGQQLTFALKQSPVATQQLGTSPCLGWDYGRCLRALQLYFWSGLLSLCINFSSLSALALYLNVAFAPILLGGCMFVLVFPWKSALLSIPAVTTESRFSEAPPSSASTSACSVDLWGGKPCSGPPSLVLLLPSPGCHATSSVPTLLLSAALWNSSFCPSKQRNGTAKADEGLRKSLTFSLWDAVIGWTYLSVTLCDALSGRRIDSRSVVQRTGYRGS
jgi:hypothetical protein